MTRPHYQEIADLLAERDAAAVQARLIAGALVTLKQPSPAMVRLGEKIEGAQP